MGMQDELRRIEETLNGGTLGVCACRVGSDDAVAYNADSVFPLASVIKAVIVAEFYAQIKEERLTGSKPITITAADHVAGSGVLAQLSPGLTLPLDDLAHLAMSVSDNTASNLVLRAVGGIAVVNARMHHEWGMPNTVIHRPIQFSLAPGDPPHTATGTPRDLWHFLQAVATGQIHSESVSARVYQALALSDDTEMLPRYLETNYYASDLQTAAPPLTVHHKPGAVTGVRNDVGIIERHGSVLAQLAIAVFTNDVPDTRWTAANQGCEAVARISELLTSRLLP